jgi:FixJ family two-component response regulator
MPGIDGVETAKKIKEHLKQNNKKELPLIFITGYADEKASKDAKVLNAADFIYKPFDKELFLRAIEHAIKNK